MAKSFTEGLNVADFLNKVSSNGLLDKMWMDMRQESGIMSSIVDKVANHKENHRLFIFLQKSGD